MSLNLEKETWLQKIKYPTGYMRSQISKRLGHYTNPVRGQYDPVYVYDLMKYLYLPFVEWDAYKSGIIDENGKVLKKPSREQRRQWNYFVAQIAYLKNQLKILLTPDRLERIIGKMAMIRESRNGVCIFETVVNSLEETRSSVIFNILQEIVTVGDMAYGAGRRFPTFRQFLNTKFYANCKECKYFAEGDCVIKDVIINDHGEVLYSEWVKNYEKKNDCLYFDKD